MAKEILFACPACGSKTDPKEPQCPECGVNLIVEPTMMDDEDKTEQVQKTDNKAQPEKKTTYKNSKKKKSEDLWIEPEERPFGDIIRHKRKID